MPPVQSSGKNYDLIAIQMLKLVYPSVSKCKIHFACQVLSSGVGNYQQCVLQNETAVAPVQFLHNAGIPNNCLPMTPSHWVLILSRLLQHINLNKNSKIIQSIFCYFFQIQSSNAEQQECASVEVPLLFYR